MGECDLSPDPEQDESTSSDAGDRDERPVAGSFGNYSTDACCDRRGNRSDVKA